ncbi:MAG: DUF952 domain-containing protein, partial [Anaerolineales bacterium]|nr:DUF952 domain-containing protein [Anaerolineales bacterium]
MSYILHITSRTSWLVAQKTGVYTADTLASEGFIHCSTREQVLRGQANGQPKVEYALHQHRIRGCQRNREQEWVD